MFVDEKAAGEAQTAEQKNRKLKLSEAIRIGARLRPQCRETFFWRGASCALGAAAEAIGGYTDERFPTDWESFFGAPDDIIGQVIVRNDCGHTRERIADWLESNGY